MLLVEAIGRVTADLNVQQGKKEPYSSFSLAVDRGYGEQEHTVFLDCMVFGDTALRMEKAKIKKGRGI